MSAPEPAREARVESGATISWKWKGSDQYFKYGVSGNVLPDETPEDAQEWANDLTLKGVFDLSDTARMQYQNGALE